jgi:predicted kinase
MYRKILGLFRLFFHLLNADNRSTIRKIVDELLNGQPTIKQKTFVMMVGYSKSGKTSYVKKNEKLKGFFNLSTNSIHDLLNNKLGFLKDDDTIYGNAYWERQYLTRIVRKRTLKKAFSNGLAVVNDSANLNRKERRKRLSMAKRYSYETVILWVTCPEDELLNRLQKADDELTSNGKKPVWVNLYKYVQKERFDPPLEREADIVEKVMCSSGNGTSY